MKTIIVILSMFPSILLAKAYYEDIQTRKGSGNTPYHYSTVICESKAGFEKARLGDDHWYWKKHSLAEFCRLAHKHRPNSCDYRKTRSLKAAWKKTKHCYERSRLTTACRNSRFANHKHFRCFHLGAHIAAERERVKQEQARLYKEWKKEVREKKRIYLEATEPIKFDLERKLKAAKRELQFQLDRERIAKMEFSEAQMVSEKFIEKQDKVVAQLNKVFEKYESEAAALQDAINTDSQAIESLHAWTKKMSRDVADIDTTLEQLRAHKNNLKDTELTEICEKSAVVPKLQSLRAKAILSKQWVDQYETNLNGLLLPEKFSSFRTAMEENLATLEQEVALRESVFHPDAYQLEQRPEICSRLSLFSAMLETRLLEAEALAGSQKLRSISQEFVRRMELMNKELLQKRQVESTKRYLSSLRAKFSRLLQLGKSNEALHLLAASTAMANLMMENIKKQGIVSNENVAELESKKEAALLSIKSESERYLSGIGLKSRLRIRITKLIEQVQRVEAILAQKPDHREIWESQILSQFESTGIPKGLPVRLPTFSSNEAMLEYDGNVAEVEIKLLAFLNQVES